MLAGVVFLIFKYRSLLYAAGVTEAKARPAPQEINNWSRRQTVNCGWRWSAASMMCKMLGVTSPRWILEEQDRSLPGRGDIRPSLGRADETCRLSYLLLKWPGRGQRMSQNSTNGILKETFLCDRLFHHHHLSQEPAFCNIPSTHLELCPFMGTPYILPDDKLLGPLHSEREACSFPWCGCVHVGRAWGQQ